MAHVSPESGSLVEKVLPMFQGELISKLDGDVLVVKKAKSGKDRRYQVLIILKSQERFIVADEGPLPIGTVQNMRRSLNVYTFAKLVADQIEDLGVFDKEGPFLEVNDHSLPTSDLAIGQHGRVELLEITNLPEIGLEAYIKRFEVY